MAVLMKSLAVARRAAYSIREVQMKRTAFLVLGVWLGLGAQSARADWNPAKRLTWTPGASNSAAIAIDSMERLHVVWNDATPGNYEIYYKKSTNGGTTWTAAKRLTWTAEDSYGAAIAVDLSDRIHIVWEDATPGDYEIYYKRSTNGGSTWSAVKRLTWLSGQSRGVKAAVDSAGLLHVVWCDDTPGDYEIYHKASTDGGISWTSAKRLTWTEGFSAWPDIAASPVGDLHIVWFDDLSGGDEIYYKKSSDSGATWSAMKRLTWTGVGLDRLDLVADPSSSLQLIWLDDSSGSSDIYYKRSKDGGDSWTAAERLTWTSGSGACPAIAADPSGPLSVVWSDNTPGNWEIYYKRSEDGGVSWTSSTRLTWGPGYSYSPALIVDPSGLVHLVWDDSGAPEAEIYYRNGN
jgi:hypothetical protein